MGETAVSPHERDASISWLNVKLHEGTAGLDPFDRTVCIIEVASPDRAWRVQHIGQILVVHPHVRPDRSTCTRVRALLEADVRQALGLDGPGARVFADEPLASRAADAPGAIAAHDRSRHAGATWRR